MIYFYCNEITVAMSAKKRKVHKLQFWYLLYYVCKVNVSNEEDIDDEGYSFVKFYDTR